MAWGERFFEDFQGLAVKGDGFGFAAAGADDVGEVAGRQTGADVAGAEGLLHGREGLALERFRFEEAVRRVQQ